MAPPLHPISIVCVFNNAEVRRACLDASIARHTSDSTRFELVPVDNSEGRFRSPGTALNYGASLAKFDTLVFVHQDVVLHSIAALQHAAALVSEKSYGIVGALGVSSDGTYHGRIRDRVILIGASAPLPVDVDSLDEVLFVISRRHLANFPLCEAPELGWHAYAVEYAIRMRSLGYRVAATDIPLTHNSLSTNLVGLTEAHDYLAARYPSAGLTRTTCGIIDPTNRHRRGRWHSAARGQLRRVVESLASWRVSRGKPGLLYPVISNLQTDIDDILELTPGHEIDMINLDSTGTFIDDECSPVRLERPHGRLYVSSGNEQSIIAHVDNYDHRRPLIVTNLDARLTSILADRVRSNAAVVGVYRPFPLWMLFGLDPHAMQSLIGSDRLGIPIGQAHRWARSGVS